ncbi:MerR family transcriptional regulator [Mariniluteicoccus endophyticus]
MRISALAAATAVPVATLKYYLREGLLHPGRATSRTQADYDDSHVERVRLVRALIEVGGLSLATVKRVLAVIEESEVKRLGVLGAAQRSLLGPELVELPESYRPGPGETRAHAWLRRRGWAVDPGDPVIDALDRAWAACEDAGLGLDEARLDAYADAAEEIARIDVDSLPAEPTAAVRQVVLGTLLVDPVLAALRRLAQQHVAVSREGAAAHGAE